MMLTRDNKGTWKIKKNFSSKSIFEFRLQDRKQGLKTNFND